MWERIGKSCRWLAFPMVMLAMSACDHKELDFSGVADLTVDFDWSGISGANPSSMMLAAFSATSQPVQKPLSGKSGGSIMLPEGKYQLIAYNGDTETLYSQGANWSDFEICAQPTEFSSTSRMFAGTRTIPRGQGTENQNLVHEPDLLWTSAYDEVAVTGNVGRRVSMPMEDATYVIRFTIRNVENIDYIHDKLATVSGMSGSWLPAHHRCSATECIIPFELSADGKTLSGAVRTFGHHQGGDLKHLLVIYAEMSDGSKLYYTFDVTEAIDDADPASGEVTVELEELPLPRPINNGTGLHPDVMDWQEVHIPVEM